MAAAGPKVLVADDEPEVHEFVQAALEGDGYQVLTAADGQAALEVARAEQPDLVILDVQMPKKNGFQAFAELRGGQTTNTIPVIMLTSIRKRTGVPLGAPQATEYLGGEPEAFLDKPIEPQALRATVARLLQTRPPA